MKITGNSQNFIRISYSHDQRHEANLNIPVSSQKHLAHLLPGETTAKKLALEISYKDFRLGISHTRLNGSFFASDSNNKRDACPIIPSYPGDSKKTHLNKTESRRVNKGLQSPADKAEESGGQVDKITQLVPSPGNDSKSDPYPTITLFPLFSFNSAKMAIQSYLAMQNVTDRPVRQLQVAV